ncbi:hypothetical protein RhiJN_26826 [Ceratobasidium sp. AG-Ba]|nr:hypothetical protein RhiJN_12775 [Ceratobasidium sp. AG-Ba]QRV98807.1 hypothetical protein RhiJN_26826 [Ceratobasidium sp. AG-Ba]
MARFTPTGRYQKRIIDVHPQKGVKLPPEDQFHAFFSKFGPILKIYHQPSKKSSKVDHTYVVFEDDDGVTKFKQYWGSKTASGYWKDSCKMITGIANAPCELMDLINSQIAGPSSSKGNLSVVSREEEELSNIQDPEDEEPPEADGNSEENTSTIASKPSKRKREEPTTEQPQTKKKRPVPESESGEPGSSTDSLPAIAPEDESEQGQDEESHVWNMKKEPRTPRLSPTPPALEFAKQALILAAKARKRSLQTQAANDVISELERLKAERDEARAERDAMREERDEALVERDAAIESSREAQRELQELKDAIEERDERTDEVLGLVTASLQSLRRKSRRTAE